MKRSKGLSTNQAMTNGRRVLALKNKVESYDSDLNRPQRLEKMRCRFCTYIDGHLGGQAFTDWECALCGTVSTHASTDVPALCLDCAKHNGLCAHCGAIMDFE